MLQQLKSNHYLLVISIICVILIYPYRGLAQEQPFMSPYEADSNTVVLFHFDGNLNNASSLHVEDGTSHGSVSYSNADLGDKFGKMVWIDNDSPEDSTFISVADTNALDMTGSWTIEFWVNILTFGVTSDDWRGRPEIVSKPGGSSSRGQVNYQALVDGALRNFSANYYTLSDGGDWINIETSNNVFEVGKWFHGTYIRDSTNQLQALLVHDVNGKLVGFSTSPFDEVSESPPNTTDSDLTLGWMKGKSDKWLDGFLDEVRISNVVRSFNAPPVLSDLSSVNNKDTSTASSVSVNVNNVQGNVAKNVTLHYNAGNGWQSVTMSRDSGQVFSGQIPSFSKGTSIAYYAEATNKNGLSAVIPRGASSTSGPYHSFAIVGNRQVLNLTFENGSLPPSTNSMIKGWTMGGNPRIAEEGANGTSKSLYLEGDSSYVKGTNPDAAFMKSGDFVLDTWIKADSTLPGRGTRIMIKESIPPEFNFFQFSMHRGGGGLRVASWFPNADFNRSGNLMNLGLIDTSMTPNTWYRYVAIVNSSDDTLHYRFYGSDNKLIGKFGTSLEPNVDVHPSNGPFFMGVKQDALPLGPFYKGYIDELKFYNYIPQEYAGTGVAIKSPEQIPNRVTLSGNYPNPFNPTTNIRYQLPGAREVTLKVYDVLGREVATLVDKRQKAGSHAVTFDARSLSSGVYFYQLKTDHTRKVRKMMLVK